MCQASIFNFIKEKLEDDMVRGKNILEVGSYDHNGNLRKYIEGVGVSSYHGVDLEMGPCVDEICAAENLVDKFGTNSFDVVICTEVVEHVYDWRAVINNLKGVLKPKGLLILTTRSFGFVYHAFPNDYWRYELDDMKSIFNDFDIVELESDPGPEGVFIIASKPETHSQSSAADLETVNLYNIITGSRIKMLTKSQLRRWKFEWIVRRAMARLNPDRKRNWTEVV